MGTDPNTGIYTPDVSYQPQGAMGAVIQLLNSQKANQIAQTLQQQREASAQMEQQQASDLASAATRHAQAREAAGAALQANPNADWDTLAKTQVPFGDFKDVAPFATRTTSASTIASGRSTVQAIKSASDLSGKYTAMGIPVAQQGPLLAKAFGQDIADTITSQPGASEPAGVPAAREESLLSGAEDKRAHAKRISEMTPAEISALGSLSTLRRAEASYYQIRTALDKVDVKDPEYKNLIDRKNKLDANITGLLKSMGHLMEDPETQSQIENLQAEKSDVDRKIATKEAARGASKTGTADPSTYTPFSTGPGSSAPTPAAGASSSPSGTTDLTIKVPTLPGK